MGMPVLRLFLTFFRFTYSFIQSPQCEALFFSDEKHGKYSESLYVLLDDAHILPLYGNQVPGAFVSFAFSWVHVYSFSWLVTSFSTTSAASVLSVGSVGSTACISTPPSSSALRRISFAR